VRTWTSCHQYPLLTQGLRLLLEEADNLFYRISTNSSLLDKLRKDLIEAKYRYGMCQTDLANAENESIKLKKTKDSQSLNFGEIVSDLVSIVFEEHRDLGDQNEVEALQTFAGLLSKINSAVENGSNFKIEFTFMNSEDTATRAVVRSSGDREKLLPLTGDKFDKSSLCSPEWFKLTSFFSKLKEPLSIESLQKFPTQVEPHDGETAHLEKHILPLAKCNWSKGRKEVREHLKLKFLPMSLRPKLWKSYIYNPAGITKKTYSMYRDILDKQKTHSGGVFGSQPLIIAALNQTLAQIKVKVSSEVFDSVVRMLSVFEYQHPEVGFVPGMEKIVFLLRSLVAIEEETAYVIFYNIYFSSDLLWSVLTSDHVQINKHLRSLQGLVSEFSRFKEMYLVNKDYFERFFVESAISVFVGVFSPELIEKLLDYLIVVDDTVLFMVMLCIIKRFDNYDMSKLRYEKAREFLLTNIRETPDCHFIQHILMTSANYKEIRECITKHTADSK